MENQEEICPTCGSPLAEPTTTPTGKKLQRCSTGGYDSATRQVTGCDYVKWLTPDPEKLDEKCPKCGSPLMIQTTRFGKKMKKCTTNVWNPTLKKAEGCDYVEWLNGSSEALDEECPKCGNKLIMFTTNAGKKMKKCSTAKWNSATKSNEGCDFVEWQNAPRASSATSSGPDEFADADMPF